MISHHEKNTPDSVLPSVVVMHPFRVHDRPRRRGVRLVDGLDLQGVGCRVWGGWCMV